MCPLYYPTTVWLYCLGWASLLAQTVKNLPAMQETQVWSLRWEDLPEKRMATHSSILAWRIPWTEEQDGLQSMVLQRVGQDWVTNTLTFTVLFSLLTFPDDYFHFSLLRPLMPLSPSLLSATRWKLIGTITITSVHVVQSQSLSSCTRSHPTLLNLLYIGQETTDYPFSFLYLCSFSTGSFQSSYRHPVIALIF